MAMDGEASEVNSRCPSVATDVPLLSSLCLCPQPTQACEGLPPLLCSWAGAWAPQLASRHRLQGP
jgi:hypothetical protein